LAQEPDYSVEKENLKKQMWKKMNDIGDHFENNSYYEKHWIEDRIIKRTATL